jgi:hypothetical protein
MRHSAFLKQCLFHNTKAAADLLLHEAKERPSHHSILTHSDASLFSHLATAAFPQLGKEWLIAAASFFHIHAYAHPRLVVAIKDMWREGAPSFLPPLAGEEEPSEDSEGQSVGWMRDGTVGTGCLGRAR